MPSRDSRSLERFRAAILSDHPTTRIGLRVLLERQAVEVAVNAAAGPEECSRIMREHCTLAVLDVGSTAMETCLTICDALVRAPLSVPVIGVHCCGPPPVRLHPLLEVGMRCYVSIADDEELLGAALRAVARGGSLVDVGHARLAETLHGVPKLSDRDVTILQLLVQGLTDQRVGDRIGLGGSSVKHRMQEIMRAYGIAGRCQLGAWAVASRLVDYPATNE